METKAVDLLKAPTDEEDRSALSGAKEFLLAELTDGPMTAKQVEKSAGDAGIRERTLRRAKSMLGIRSTKEADGSWTWSLPGKDAQDGQVPTDGSLGKVGNLASDKGAVILFFYRKMVKVAKPIRLDMLMATFEEPAVETGRYEGTGEGRHE